MFVNNRFKVTIFFILLIVLNGCKKSDKEVQPAFLSNASHPFATREQVDSLQHKFSVNNLEQKLIESLSASVKIYWKPIWNKDSVIKKSVNSVSYFFVPVEAENLISKTRVKVRKAKKYLLFIHQKQRDYVFLATYLPKKAFYKSSETELGGFSGRLMLYELNDDFYTVYFYKDGVRQQNPPSAQSVARDSQRTASNCLLYVTCIWQLACNILPNEAFNYPRNTIELTYPDPDDPTCPEPSPSHECTYAYWVHTASNTSLVCSAGYEPAPPLPSPNGTGSNAPGTAATDPALARTISSLAAEMRFNDAALFGPCPDKANKWLPVINFKPPTSVYNKLDKLRDGSFYQIPGAPHYASTYQEWWYVQGLKEAKGPIVNLDYYSINFDRLPVVNGKQLTVEETLNHIRLNLTGYSGVAFVPSPYTNSNETANWNGNPLNAVINIAIPVDRGDVIVSDYSVTNDAASWTFSTIHTPFAYDHPVSGTRMFGVEKTASSYVFYTRGADRLTGYGDAFIGLMTDIKNRGQYAIQYDQGDQLWRSLMTKLKSDLFDSQAINSSVNQPMISRPDFDQLEQIIRDGRSLTSIECL